jgi:hypothetical protein
VARSRSRPLPKVIGVCNMTALRMLPRGPIKGRQVCPGAPWAIRTADLVGLSDRKRSKRKSRSAGL